MLMEYFWSWFSSAKAPYTICIELFYTVTGLKSYFYIHVPVIQTALLKKTRHSQRRVIMFLSWRWSLNYEVSHTVCDNHASISLCLLFHWLSRGLCMIAWMSVSPQRCIAIVHLSLLHLCNCMHEVSTVNPNCWQVVCSCSAGYSGKPLAEGYWFFLSWQTSWKITQRGAR